MTRLLAGIAVLGAAVALYSPPPDLSGFVDAPAVCGQRVPPELAFGLGLVLGGFVVWLVKLPEGKGG